MNPHILKLESFPYSPFIFCHTFDMNYLNKNLFLFLRFQDDN